jgi:hypothetical protein
MLWLALLITALALRRSICINAGFALVRQRNTSNGISSVEQQKPERTFDAFTYAGSEELHQQRLNIDTVQPN